MNHETEFWLLHAKRFQYWVTPASQNTNMMQIPYSLDDKYAESRNEVMDIN